MAAFEDVPLQDVPLSGISQQNCEFEANAVLKNISPHVIKEKG